VNQPDPGLPLRCPTCREPLRFRETKREPDTTYLYACEHHGYFEFELRDQRFRPVAPDLHQSE